MIPHTPIVTIVKLRAADLLHTNCLRGEFLRCYQESLILVSASKNGFCRGISINYQDTVSKTKKEKKKRRKKKEKKKRRKKKEKKKKKKERKEKRKKKTRKEEKKRYRSTIPFCLRTSSATKRSSCKSHRL